MRRLDPALHRAHWLGLLALLVLSQLAFWQQSTDPFAPVQALVIKLLVPLCLLPWLWRHAPGQGALLKPWPARLLLAWMAWLWVAAVLSPFADDGLKTALEYNLYASAFFLPAACTLAQRRVLLAAFLAAAVLAAGYGFLQHFGVDFWLWSTDFGGRPLGTIGNPNFFGGHLVLAWGLGLAWLIGAGPGRRRLPALVFALLSVVQWWSRSVGPWLGMAGAAALALALLLAPGAGVLRQRAGLTRARILQGLGAGLLLGALFLASPPGQALRHKLGQEKAVSVTNRLMMWKAAVELWQRAPLQGAGLGSYRPLYPDIQAGILAREPEAGWNYVVTWLPHQNYLYLLAETGLLGLGLFMAFWLAVLARGWARARDGDREALGPLLACAGLLGVGLLNTFSNIAPTALGFFFLAGLLAWPARDPAPALRPLGAEALAASLVLALGLGLPAGRELAANRLTREAARYERRDQHAAAVAFWRKAAEQGHANFTPQSLVGVHYRLGEALRMSGRLAEAVEAYRQDLKANPHAPEVHNMLGAALGQMGAQALRADWVAQSVEHLAEAERLNPGYGAALLNLGGSRMILGDYSGAAQAWEKLLRHEPGHAEARAYLQGLKGRR